MINIKLRKYFLFVYYLTLFFFAQFCFLYYQNNLSFPLFTFNFYIFLLNNNYLHFFKYFN